MKKIAFFSIFIFVLLTSHAQVQLLHSIDCPADIYYSNINFETVYEPVDCYVISQVPDNTHGQINIYDANFSLIKTINLALSDFTWDIQPTRFDAVNVNVVGRHLINTDDKIEMVVRAYAHCFIGEEEWINSSNTIIINEDGELIHDFGIEIFYSDYGNFRNNIACIHKAGDQLRLGAFTSSPDYLNIYSLGGNYNPSTMITYPQPNVFPNPYPNPSRNTIALPYTLQPGETSQLRVYNMGGQLVETFNVGSDFDRVLLNVSNYSKGTYVYTYNGVSKKFVVQ